MQRDDNKGGKTVRITKRQLRRIIREEKKKILAENKVRTTIRKALLSEMVDKDAFRMDKSADSYNTSRVAQEEISPRDMVRIFGDYGPGDPEVSGHYTFVGRDGEIFTVYDYNIIDPDYGPTAEEFWASDDGMGEYLNIGGTGDPTKFLAWLRLMGVSIK